MTLLDKVGGETGTAEGEAVRTQISVPPTVDLSQPVISTSSLTLDERWAPNRNTAFKAGDALVRTIARTAEDVPSLAMRELLFTAPEGVRLYREAPQSEDKVDRGALTGRRIDRVTYVVETAGIFRLTAISQPWWDLGAGRLQAAEGGGILVAASATPVTKPGKTSIWETAFWRDPSNGPKIVIVLASIAAAAWAIVRGARWSWAAWCEHRRRWRQSEAHAFDGPMAVCRSGDARAIYRAFVLWRSRLPAASAACAAPLATEVEKVLFGGESDAAGWSSERSRLIPEELQKLPRSLAHRKVEDGTSSLPPLNPLSFGRAE